MEIPVLFKPLRGLSLEYLVVTDAVRRLLSACRL